MRNQPEAPDEADLFLMEQGQEVHALARQMYCGDTPAQGEGLGRSTLDLCARASIKTLFEASVQAGPFVARADILCRHGDGWHVLEVKSSFSDSGNVSDYIDALAYTVMVFHRVGIPVTKSSLILLSRNYRYGDSVEQLFVPLDETDAVNARVAEFEAQADEVARVLLDPSRPIPKLVSACRDCPAYETACLGAGCNHTVLEIPRLQPATLQKLSNAGVVDAQQVPRDLKLNPSQQRAIAAIKSGETIVEPGLAATLETIHWPCYYLDFETVNTFLPLYPGIGCHRQLLTQFSVHRREDMNRDPSHAEYLANASRDCERELASALIDALGREGSVMMYTGFEKQRIQALRERFPEFGEPLEQISARLVDLANIIRANVYHPEFHGSFSIKQVLPALVPDLSYAGLNIGNGGTAVARFARMAKGEITGDAAQETRRQLLEYCNMDTYAMVKLHEVLVGLANSNGRAQRA